MTYLSGAITAIAIIGAVYGISTENAALVVTTLATAVLGCISFRIGGELMERLTEAELVRTTIPDRRYNVARVIKTLEAKKDDAYQSQETATQWQEDDGTIQMFRGEGMAYKDAIETVMNGGWSP